MFDSKIEMKDLLCREYGFEGTCKSFFIIIPFETPSENAQAETIVCFRRLEKVNGELWRASMLIPSVDGLDARVMCVDYNVKSTLHPVIICGTGLARITERIAAETVELCSVRASIDELLLNEKEER